ncbi:MAG: hypothetical protein ABIR79_16520 [Candidatus Binatia bacterium]
MDADAQWLLECPECGHHCSEEDERESSSGPCIECPNCSTWTAADEMGPVEASTSDDDADAFLHGTIPDEGVEETAEEADFRRMTAAMEQAQGLLDAAETTGEQERIREAINRKAWEEIGIFIEETA